MEIVMRLSAFGLLLVSLLAFPIAAASVVADRIGGHVARFLFAVFPQQAPRLAGDAFDIVVSVGGTALPADVQHALRHEAGVSRYSAARNT
jgi:hypothetical protein